MSYQPFVVGTGLVAWRNLQRTLPAQLDAFANSAKQSRMTEHFKQKAPSLTSAEEVVADRQVLSVALGAYGLQDDLNNRYFIKRVLSEGASEADSLANRMADSRYERLASDFALDGLSQFVGVLPSVASTIVEQFTQQSFALSIGERQPNLRLALNADSELSRVAALDVSDDAKWFTIMGNPPLRTVMETAFGLPSSFGKLDIDRQLDVFRERALETFGVSEVSEFGAEALKSHVIDRFLLKDQLKQGQSLSAQNIALQMLGA